MSADGNTSQGVRGFFREWEIFESSSGVVGAGTAGLTAAALLARAGHSVQVLERAPNPGPVGAGLLLQPTGIGVLKRLGVLDEVTAGAARIAEVVGTTVEGKRFMDLAYSGLGEGAHGLGVHRGALFTALRGAAQRAGAALLPGVEIVRRQDRTLIDAGGARYGPYDRIVGADGARSTMRRFLPFRARIHEHRWGALWGVFRTRRGPSTRSWTSTSTARGGWSASSRRARTRCRCSGRSGWTASTRCGRRASRPFATTCSRWRRWPSRGRPA